MIHSITIKNFKSLSSPFEIPIKPILLLVGPNSSGKSSFIQVLLLFKQTIDSRDMENPLLLNGKYVSLGAFDDIIFGHDKNLKFEVEFKISSRKFSRSLYRTRTHNKTVVYRRWSPKKYPDNFLETFVNKFKFNPFELEFIKVKTNFGYDNKKKRIVVDDYKVSTLFLEKEIPLFSITNRGKNVNIPLLNLTENQRKTLLRFQRKVKFYYLLLPRFNYNYYRLFRTPLKRAFIDFIIEISSNVPFILQEDFEKIFYLGPLREYPQRYYIATGETPIDVGLRGESAVDVIFKDKFSPYSKVAEKLTEWFKKFNLAYQIDLESIAPNLSKLIVKDSHTRIPVNISDVGFGASQILPLIVEGFHCPDNSIIISEQPEIHLHPKIQAELGDMLIDIVNENKFIIIETHSEHLLARVRRRIAEGKIPKKKVSIYYFEPESRGTRIDEIILDDDGQYLCFPKGFFEEDVEEAFKHLKAIKMRNSRNQNNE